MEKDVREGKKTTHSSKSAMTTLTRTLLLSPIKAALHPGEYPACYLQGRGRLTAVPVEEWGGREDGAIRCNILTRGHSDSLIMTFKCFNAVVVNLVLWHSHLKSKPVAVYVNIASLKT